MELHDSQTWEHKTVDEWSTDINNEVNGKLGHWRILPREILSSKAYRSLSLPEREILHCYLNKVRFVKVGKSEQRRMKRSNPVPENARNLIVTNNEIKARGGCKSDSTISKARKRLVEIGFLDVIRPCRFPQPGIFGLSERFKEYPSGNYQPKDNRPVSFAPYPRQPVDGRFRDSEYIIQKHLLNNYSISTLSQPARKYY